MRSRVVKLAKHIINDDSLEAIKEEIQKWYKLQLVPQDTHYHNAAKRAIQTLKNHFLVIFSGVDQNFSMHLWGRLILQAVLTLNLHQQSQVVLTISAYAYLYGVLDYYATLLSLMGCAIQIHNTTKEEIIIRAFHQWMDSGHITVSLLVSSGFWKEEMAEIVSDTAFFNNQYTVYCDTHRCHCQPSIT